MHPDDSRRDKGAPDAGPEEDAPQHRHQPASRAGMDREVGDLEDPGAEDEGALPGRAGGGLAGG